MRQCELEEENTADVVIKRSEHVFTEMRDITDWDQEVTGKLGKTGEILDIKLLDHVIVARNGFYSFKDHGLI